MASDVPSRPSAPRIAIIGGGIIGRACGRELLRAGFRVRVYDATGPLPAGSASAAGLLGPVSEFLAGDVPDPLINAGLESLDLWAEWARELGDIGFRQAGCLHLGQADTDGDRFAQMAARAGDHGFTAQMLDEGAVRRIDRRLKSSETAIGLLLPHEAEIQPGATLAALRADFMADGGEWTESRAVRLIENQGIITGVQGEGDGFWAVDAVLIAAGAASRDFAGWAQELGSIYPIKGQLAVLDALSPPLPTVLRFQGGYLAPKTDGTMLLGASMEPDRTDATIEPRVIAQLLANLGTAAPGLAHLRAVHGRAGLRAGAREGMPLVGRLGIPGLWAATGHGRNGFLLAPFTARRIAEAMATEFGLSTGPV